MASTGEAATTGAGASSSYPGGGVGGKFRKRPLRRSSQATPYDRPSSSLRNPSWLSKLVLDPASKLISLGAQRFFSAIIPSKRLPSPPSPQPQTPEQEQKTRDGLQETAQDNRDGVPELVTKIGGSSICKYDTSGLPELEQLLKQKTFTRSEISRLTELLHSRAVDLPVKDDEHGVELSPYVQTNHSKPMLEDGKLQEFTTLSGNNIERLGAQGAVAIPAVTKTKHLEDQIASPAELAKAYMGSRTSKVSPSTLGLRAQLAREDSILLGNSPSTSKSHISSLAVRTPTQLGVTENGFTTPRSHGRSAIYNMARTPYSRVYPATLQKAGGSTNYGYSRPSVSASQSTWDDGGQAASKPTALKRRSSVLDDDIGSIGPIRRIRQKPNLLSHGKVLGSNNIRLQKLPLVGDANTRVSNAPSTSYAHVPPESSEMAARILEHLEKMTPKEKASESKLAAPRERSTYKLTPDVLRVQALRSLDDLDASKLLQHSQKSPKSGDQPSSHSPESSVMTSQKQGRVEEQGPSKSVLFVDKLSPDTMGSDKFVKNGAVLNSSAPHFERKHAFKMSAHEDWLELDDDRYNSPALNSVEEKRVGSPMTDSKSALNEYTAFDSPHEVATAAPPLSRKTESDSGNAAAAGDKGTGFNFSTAVSTPNSHVPMPSLSALATEKPTTAADSPLIFGSGSSSVSNIIPQADYKAESLSSMKNVINGATDAAMEVTDSSKINGKTSELDNSVDGNSGTPPIVSSSIATATNTSADAPSRNLVSNNMPLASTASPLFGSSAPASIKLPNQDLTRSSKNTASLTGATSLSSPSGISSTSAASSSSPLTDNVATSTSSVPGFNFVSPKDKSTPLSTASAIGSKEATDLKVKAVKENVIGNFNNSSPGNTVSTAASTGSSIFGFGSFASTSAANSLVQGSASGSPVSTEVSLAGSSTATVPLSMPVQFGSSSSSTVFGASDVTSSTPRSVFGFSSPATKSDVTVQSSMAPASDTNLVNCNNGAAPAPFKSGVGSTASSDANAVSSASTASLGAFIFGASPTVSTSSGISLAPSFFSFGAGSATSSATSSSSTSPGVSTFGASFSSSPTNPMISSSSAAPAFFSFGASTPASSRETNAVSSGGANSSTFGSNLHAPNSPISGSPYNSLSASTGFSFVAASSSSFGTSNSSPLVFGSTTGAPSNPVFSFSSITTSSLPSSSTHNVFGNSTYPFASTPGNNDQMSTEDSMVEDPVQSSTPTASVFGQSPVSSSPHGFMFGSTAPSAVAPFQFGIQQNQTAPQNPSQFQASGSQEFSVGGSFSLGSGGPDKSGRKIVKVNRNRNRKR